MKWGLLLAALPLHAHVMSISTGEAVISGDRLEYYLRMPAYEVEHLPHPEVALLENIRFPQARMMHSKCFREGESYVCAADYLFAFPVDVLEVTCTLYAVTVPNHVHVFHARRSPYEARAYFDYTFTSASLRFAPESAAMAAIRLVGSGALRAVSGIVQLLFLLTLILAARSQSELLFLSGAFATALVAGFVLTFPIDPRLVESAAALGIAYLAVEILFLPNGKRRWPVAVVLGLFEGLYLRPMMPDSPYAMAGGAAAAGIALVAAGLLLLGRLPRWTASFPLAAGIGWFLFRLIE